MENLVLVSGAITYKEYRGKRRWFLVKHSQDENWEIPKVVVRKVESSVRAAIRMMGEQAGITVKVLEEAGRAGGVTTINGKTLPQRHIYYLMVRRDSNSGEALGFEKFKWFEYAQAVRKLDSKRERQMLRSARKELKKWLREQEKISNTT